MRVTIRPARPADIPALLALDTHLRFDAGRPAAIQDWVTGSGCFVAELDGQPVGYAAIVDIFFCQPMIDILMVADGHRRTGIGRTLLRFLCAGCAAPKVWTSTSQSNLPMQQLLRAEGFTHAGMVEGLTEGDPELFFCKRLRPDLTDSAR